MENLKINLFALALSALSFTACNGGLPDAVSGTYVNHASGEFSIADDTLVVAHDKGDRYFIHRKTGFKVIGDNGKAGQLQRETEEWKAVYDSGSNSMTESRKGRVLTFEGGLLTLENSKYERIN